MPGPALRSLQALRPGKAAAGWPQGQADGQTGVTTVPVRVGPGGTAVPPSNWWDRPGPFGWRSELQGDPGPGRLCLRLPESAFKRDRRSKWRCPHPSPGPSVRELAAFTLDEQSAGKTAQRLPW